MKSSIENFALRVMSGEARGPGLALLRGFLRAIEPAYTAVVRLRNRKYDRGKGVRRLPRPVISVGNLTTGGTGKTPVVRWLCDALRNEGHHPAILMRGYGAKKGERGDEQAMLESYLGAIAAPTAASAGTPAAAPVIVRANPDRFEGGNEVLAAHPGVDVFVLDDGFQHRRLARDVDLVLIDATCPFGYGHVHPRGLLREPPAGLGRAHAILITRSDAVSDPALEQLTVALRRENASAPIYRARHAHTGVRWTDRDGVTVALPLAQLAGRRAFAFCGIGRPESFFKQLGELPAVLVGRRAFPDHHAYAAADLQQLAGEASAAGASILLTTEKDWVKIAPLAAACPMPVWRIELEVRFDEGADVALLADISKRLAVSPA